MKLRLLVCDDYAPARRAISALLADQADVEIVGEAADGAEAVELAEAHAPDVVLMDVRMPVLDGVEATRLIRERVPHARIVAYSGDDEMDVVMAMMEAGASDFCLKGGQLWELERAIAGAADPIVRLSRRLSRRAGAGSAASILAHEVADLTGAALAATYLVAPGAGLALAAVAGPAAGSCRAAAPELAARAFAEARFVEAEGTLALPLVATSQPVDRKLVCAVADLAAAAVATERRLAVSFEEARRDALTGLPNRRAFEEHLAKAFGSDSPVGLVMLDLDDFKEVNDRGGHEAGDRVLREVARGLLRALRADEEAFRVGGEEFAVVVEGDARAAARVAERVREALLSQRRPERLPTVSAGVASYPADADTAEELLRRADAALYAAKWAGKNRSVVYGGEDVEQPSPASISASGRVRILVVDDDAGLRTLLRTTLELAEIEVAEAGSADEAGQRIGRVKPSVIVLDVGMPGTDGLTYCKRLKADPATREIPVVLLTGTEGGTEAAAHAAGADVFLRKPFSPLELLAAVERLSGSGVERAVVSGPPRPQGEQLLLYAQDLRRLLEVERGQRELVQKAYNDTVMALASALESKDSGTGAHSQRVQRYAIELSRALDPVLLDDQSLEYGFLLHDVGKIGIPDDVLQKPGPLTEAERRLMETHTLLGEQMLGGVALLQGEGLKVVRHHHERWDGGGYPDRLAGGAIPLGARVFAVADSLDAMTSDRPYRPAGTWDEAVAEIVRERGRLFDPDVVDAFREQEPQLRRVHYELTAA